MMPLTGIITKTKYIYGDKLYENQNLYKTRRIELISTFRKTAVHNLVMIAL